MEKEFFQMKGDLLIVEVRKIKNVTDAGIKKSDEQIALESRASAKTPFKVLAVGEEVTRCKAGDFIFFDGNIMRGAPGEGGYFIANIAEKEYIVTHNHAVAVVITDINVFNQESMNNKAIAEEEAKIEREKLKEQKGKIRLIN